jgi:hypothetical protein
MECGEAFLSSQLGHSGSRSAGVHILNDGACGAGPAGQSIVSGGPYQRGAAEKRTSKRAMVDVSSDKWQRPLAIELKCLPGVPRATYMPFPFRIVQGSSPYILMAYEFTSSTRIVRMNTRQEAPTPSWMGWSRGRWEGETLVVDVTGFREETWFDRAGDFHSDELPVVERRHPPVISFDVRGGNRRSKVYTRLWKMTSLYWRMEKNVQLLKLNVRPYGRNAVRTFPQASGEDKA